MTNMRRRKSRSNELARAAEPHDEPETKERAANRRFLACEAGANSGLGRAADRGEIAGAVTLVVRHGSGIDQDSFALAHQAIDD